MSFSLDSADRERHNASRKLDCYDRVLESIEIARRMNQFVNINFSVGNDTLHEIDGMLRLARDLKVVVHVMPMFAYFGNPALQKQYVERLRSLLGRPYVSINLAALKFVEEGGNDPSRPKCRAISANIAVSPDGKYLLPCYHAAVEKVPIEEDMRATMALPRDAKAPGDGRPVRLLPRLHDLVLPDPLLLLHPGPVLLAPGLLLRSYQCEAEPSPCAGSDRARSASGSRSSLPWPPRSPAPLQRRAG